VGQHDDAVLRAECDAPAGKEADQVIAEALAGEVVAGSNRARVRSGQASRGKSSMSTSHWYGGG
jgi:hypothetical protein